MNNQGSLHQRTQPQPSPTSVHFVFGVFGFVAPIVTYVIAVSDVSRFTKIGVLIVISAAYTFLCGLSLYKLRGSSGIGEEFEGEKISNELTDKLHALDEAHQFFSSSLKPSDMFRLVSNRVAEIYPHSASALFVVDDTHTKLQIVEADGLNSRSMIGLEFETDCGLAGMAYLSGEVETDSDLRLVKFSMPPSTLTGFMSSVAIPLHHDGRVFGIYQLFSEEADAAPNVSAAVLEAVGNRIAPLFLGSIAFARSLSNALTDAVTRLPNERAFFMVLENQLAESLRFRDERPLTVLSVDIKGFAEANEAFGHATGDKMLEFVAENLKSGLRKMDFLARAVNDEFVIILPTAAETTATEIIERIQAIFAENLFSLSEHENLMIRLNVGWATFWRDGDTAKQLLQNAQLRKQQAKSEDPSKVLWFPKEYVN